MGGQRHAQAAFPPGNTRYQLYRRLGGRVQKPRPHRDSIPVPSSPKRVAIPTELSRSLKTTQYYTITTLLHPWLFLAAREKTQQASKLLQTNYVHLLGDMAYYFTLYRL